MKIQLERKGEVIEFSRLGRVVFTRDASGTETEQGYFDDDAAEAALQVTIDARREDGWVEPAAQLEAHARVAEQKAALARQLERHRALTSRPDVAAAFRELAGPLLAGAPEQLERLAQQVERLGDPAERGVTVYLRGGAELDWCGDEVTLFCTPRERDDDEPSLEYRVSDGPPLGDEEIEDEVQGEITWFMNEWIYDFWFFTSEDPARARWWNHDGGIRGESTPARALGDRLLALAFRGDE